MKNVLILTLVLLLVISCKETLESGSAASKNTQGILDEVTGKNEDINEKYNLLLKELSTKTPLINDQFIEAFPKKLGNLSLGMSEDNKVEPRITSSNSVVGTFGDDTIRMEILDAAGQNAIAAIIPLKMLHLNKITSENNNTIRYSKKERNGILTFGTDRNEDTPADYQAEIRFLYDNRFYVTLEGKKMNVDELWKAIRIDDLIKFKKLNN